MPETREQQNDRHGRIYNLTRRPGERKVDFEARITETAREVNRRLDPEGKR